MTLKTVTPGTASCEICGDYEDLRIAPIMTGDRFGKPAQHPVCGACVRAWYESGETTPSGILRYRAETGR